MIEETENFRTSYEWGEVDNPITDDELKEWIKRLRSGEYLQATGELKVEDYEYTTPSGSLCSRKYVKPHFCCLGVLQEQCEVEVSQYAMTLYRDVKNKEVYLKLPSDLQDDLARMNDGGDSFKKIATFLEKGFNLTN